MLFVSEFFEDIAHLQNGRRVFVIDSIHGSFSIDPPPLLTRQKILPQEK